MKRNNVIFIQSLISPAVLLMPQQMFTKGLVCLIVVGCVLFGLLLISFPGFFKVICSPFWRLFIFWLELALFAFSQSERYGMRCCPGKNGCKNGAAWSELSLIFPHQIRFRQHVPLYCFEQFVFCQSCFKIQHCIQSV